MIDLDVTLLIQLVNFLIIWMVLDLLLLKPIRGIIKKRTNHMDQQMNAIEGFTKDASDKLEGYEKSLAAARTEGSAERDKLKDEGSVEEGKLLAAASQEAAGKVAAAKGEIGSQADAAKKALKDGVSKMAERAADRILSQA
ncbi:MAG: ATP synthase F0 subunit B [Desulfovibrio sp.]|uniref:ATP synthase F0 subunit B n=1 Tax=Desulfovibrio sp. 7SRBS1 TaxID=3378064 RepID=UPI003B3D3889